MVNRLLASVARAPLLYLSPFPVHQQPQMRADQQ